MNVSTFFQELGSCKETTFGMIKPDAICKMGDIIDLIMENGLLITKLKKIRIDRLTGFTTPTTTTSMMKQQ